MGSKIYVGGLPYSTAEQELADLFGQHGAVTSAKIITDKYTGQSRGFGFIEMTTRQEGEKAIQDLNGKEVQGRALAVNEAREQQGSRSGGGGGGGRGGHHGGGHRGGRGGGY